MYEIGFTSMRKIPRRFAVPTDKTICARIKKCLDFLRTKTQVERSARGNESDQTVRIPKVSGRSEAEHEQSISLADFLGKKSYKNDLFLSPVGFLHIPREWQSLLWTVMLEIQSNQSPGASNIL